MFTFVVRIGEQKSIWLTGPDPAPLEDSGKRGLILDFSFKDRIDADRFAGRNANPPTLAELTEFIQFNGEHAAWLKHPASPDLSWMFDCDVFKRGVRALEPVSWLAGRHPVTPEIKGSHIYITVMPATE